MPDQSELNEFQQDALKESLNIGIGRAAATLSSLIGNSIKLNVPHIDFVKLTTIKSHLDDNYKEWASCVIIPFDGGIEGDSILIFSKDAAQSYMRLVIEHQFDGELDGPPEMEIDFLMELGNIIINSCIGSICNLLETNITDGLPQYVSRAGGEIFDEILESSKTDSFGMIVKTNFSIEGESSEIDLIITFKNNSMDAILGKLSSLV